MSTDLEQATYRSLSRSRTLFVAEYGKRPSQEYSNPAKIACKRSSEYGSVRHMEAPKSLQRKRKGDQKQAVGPSKQPTSTATRSPTDQPGTVNTLALVQANNVPGGKPKAANSSLAIVSQATKNRSVSKELALAAKAPTMPKPEWHPQWKLMRVISGHSGWVRCVTVEPKNEWFVSGSSDRTIKIWDLASGTLKLTLTGHVSSVRGLEVSNRHPYLFSVGEDKSVKCWDLEQNKVIRHYHGHLSAVYALKLHPTLDVLFTGGRDATVRVWDMRTKSQIHCLTGHTSTVASLVSREVDPQVISGSHDSTIKLWDIRKARVMTTLTNHKKSVRALALHPAESTFTSGAADRVKQWYLPKGKFIQNIDGHSGIINAMAVNPAGVLVSGSDNGKMNFWDYRTGYQFQSTDTIAQPGSLDSECGIFGMTFDKSYSRLITAEADKTIKIYKEDPESTEETHPLQWKAGIIKRGRF